ncbi:MAG: hypothetical protein KDA57_20410 [Planctomycetales bacterium]|nr:hypothetical protein [Planctomycetales bacterium]
MNSPKYKKAIGRNLAELQWVIIHRTTLQGIEQAKPVYHYFLHSAYTGLFNDYVAHCLKVFDLSIGSASFWYIYRTHEKRVKDFGKASGIDVDELQVVAQRLKHIRDKTHFHIDPEGVLDPKAIWRQADITGKRLAQAVDAVWKILTHLQQLLGLPEVNLPNYTIKSAKEAALRAESPQSGLQQFIQAGPQRGPPLNRSV